ncbi:flagellar hook-length control protein FliK [Desulfofustis glycolicus]|uniref:Flagellar hook-length control protein FliK n=1 Tax=Desulfofustis glycolicus DSM 9705 TaxID=1121409 RepID=A0A1M5U2M2_9BACT|nr:flagellar hook-length control protein FliK [Desulfofustis glycolicus]MCB2214705.1 flagellar hook-length control protein FliK [Desulfobulbaceae bacterium]SHH56913.1 Flagellar hook-length control protein FliK [Desulfofustis glycolicus DSM 9705]
MDIIPTAPAPKLNAPSAKTTRGAAGTESGSGFDQTLKQAVSSEESVKQPPAKSEGNAEQQRDPAADQATTAATDKLPPQNSNERTGATAPEEAAAPPEPDDVSPAGVAASVEQQLLALLFGRSAQAAGSPQVPVSWQTPAGLMLNQALQSLTQAGTPIELVTGKNSALTVALEHGSNTMVPPATGRQMDALLAQLQALITGNNDQVTVTASFQSADRAALPGYLSGPLVDTLMAGTNGAANQQANLFTGLPGEQPPLTAEALLQKHSELPATSLRQENGGPELHSRLAVFQNNSAEQKNDQGGQQQPAQHQATAGQQTVTTLLPQADGSTTSHGFTAQFQEAATQQSAAASRLAGQATSLPAGQYVAENDVIGQIIQRFSLQTSLHTSKMNLKLHPAELGELKISLVVKEDSLKANIYAQTRQAQEIIEKHLPRLKTILEEQGLVVEDLLVTLESDFLEDSTSQQSQSFAQQMSEFERGQGGRGDNNLFHQSLEDLPAGAEPGPLQSSGVNLTV